MPHALKAETAEHDEFARRLARQESEIASLSTELLDRYEEATFVYRLSAGIGSALGESAIARLVLQDVAGLLGAGSGTLWLRSEGGAWREAAAWPDRRRGRPDLDAHGLLEALAQGRPWLPDTTADDEPAIAVGIPDAEGSAFGAIVLAARGSQRPYRAGDLKLLAAVASLTSAFVRNHRLSEKARRADARRREDDIARQIHRGLLPREDPRIAGLDVSGGFRAAEIVGGDFYGYVVPPDGTLGLAMADVSGHGVGAALYMATAKGAIQSEGRRIVSPREILARTNEVLLGDFSGSDVFATALFARFFPAEGRLLIANGGHNPPALIRGSGDVRWLGAGGPALGVFDDAVYREDSVPFEAGDTLIVYTDGLVEARDGSRRLLGADRLVALARSLGDLPATVLKERIFEELDAHVGGGALHDDVTLVVVRCAAPGPRGETP